MHRWKCKPEKENIVKGTRNIPEENEVEATEKDR